MTNPLNNPIPMTANGTNTRFLITYFVSKKIESHFNSLWQQKFNKKYDEKEDRLRKTIFLETITKIDHFNHSGNHSYTQGIDEFTDWVTY